MKKTLTVADFFCGAGGFSEGFRQAGFEIKYALDSWHSARETHELNHPKCNHPSFGNILLISPEKIGDLVDDTDIIIGSPPCVSFSTSNRAGNANKSLGIKLIKKFLQIIAVKKHKKGSILKYWLMENVPNSRKYLKDNYTFKDLGLDDALLKKFNITKKESDVALSIERSRKNIYNSADFGVPQRRERFICGEFPKPKKTHPIKDSWISLKSIIDPLNLDNVHHIIDPNYNFEIKSEDLTDHFYDTTIPPFEWKEAKIKKEQARYYGKMPFPENEDSPSRTVMATRSVLSRESMILKGKKHGSYRAPTIREISCLMSFPITYLFQARDESSKYRLVGNAVCPKLAYSFAKEISKREKIKPKRHYKFSSKKEFLMVDLRHNQPPKKKVRNRHPLSNFIEIVPDLKYRNFRVELDNNSPKQNKGVIKWSASIHHATGKDNMKSAYPTLSEVRRILSDYKDQKRIKLYFNHVKKEFSKNIPKSSKKFQEQFCRPKNDKNYLTPRKTLQRIKIIVDLVFPEITYKDVMLSNICDFKKQKKHINFGKLDPPNNQIPLRHLAALYALIYVTSYMLRK